jgi:high-affinity K+ transport system ATPase subunit B
VIQGTPSILAVPLICCLVVMLSNVVSVAVAAAHTHKALLFARQQIVHLADAVNIVFAQESRAMAEERKLVESTSLELTAQITAGPRMVRARQSESERGGGGSGGGLTGACVCRRRCLCA